MPARPPHWKAMPPGVHPALVAALGERDITRLYSHQAQAWDEAAKGNNIVVVTGTASGKTLAYNLPVLDCLLRDAASRSLYLFPTKALAHDQATALKTMMAKANASAKMGNHPPVEVATYDGDTPQRHRPSIRKNARLVITNPDMLHMGILPHHTSWAGFFENLRYVVIDEMHAYRGVFGSHVANVLRRLKRVARFYGARPQFILTSATIGNPAELAERLIEQPVTLIDEDGSARGPQSFLIYNPPVIDPALGLRASSVHESVRLASDLLSYNLQSILFGRSRRTVELLLTYLREKVEAPSSVRGYRSGYLPSQRREIERSLREGAVRAVVATNALELGIDIGGMGASLLVGYPGTIAATWQQAGRAGRGEEASLAVMVATADPLDQFLAHHPNYFFGRSPEQALINPDNLLILLNHLQCAAFELPFSDGEGYGKVPGDRVREFLEYLEEEGILHHSARRFYWMADEYPAQRVSLRSASANNVVLQSFQEDLPTTLGQVDWESALWMVHPGAIYLHEADSYYVEELDLEQHVARLAPVKSDYYTQPQSETKVELLELAEEQELSGAKKAHGDIRVTTQVVGFRKLKWHTHEQLGIGSLDLPPATLETTGYWISLDEELVDGLEEQGLWRGSPIQYGPNWERQRAEARSRDQYACQVCGTPEGVRQHDVHHIVPFRVFPSFQEANRLSNLVTLCRDCHRKAEVNVRVRSGLAGLGYTLSAIAPLFLMCDPKDIGVHTDPLSPLAEGRPVVVLYDQVPAGIGFSQRLFDLHPELLTRALDLVSECECEDGCPSCVGPGGENGLGGKIETLAILRELVL